MFLNHYKCKSNKSNAFYCTAVDMAVTSITMRSKSLKQYLSLQDDLYKDIWFNKWQIEKVKKLCFMNQCLRMVIKKIISRFRIRQMKIKNSWNENTIISLLPVEEIPEKYNIKLYDRGRYWSFDARELVRSFEIGLRHHQDTYPDPVHPLNPWAGRRMTNSELHTVCDKFVEMGIRIPIFLNAFADSGFDINSFSFNYRIIIGINAIEGSIKNMSDSNIVSRIIHYLKREYKKMTNKLSIQVICKRCIHEWIKNNDNKNNIIRIFTKDVLIANNLYEHRYDKKKTNDSIYQILSTDESYLNTHIKNCRKFVKAVHDSYMVVSGSRIGDVLNYNDLTIIEKNDIMKLKLQDIRNVWLENQKSRSTFKRKINQILSNKLQYYNYITNRRYTIICKSCKRIHDIHGIDSINDEGYYTPSKEIQAETQAERQIRTPLPIISTMWNYIPRSPQYTPSPSESESESELEHQSISSSPPPPPPPPPQHTSSVTTDSGDGFPSIRESEIIYIDELMRNRNRNQN